MAKMEAKDPKAGDGAEENGNGSNGASPQSKTAKWIGDCMKPLDNEIKAAASAEKIGCLGYEEQKTAGQLRICRIVDARKVRQEYQSIRGCVSLGMNAHAGAIKSNVALYLAKNTELGTKLTASLEAVKGVKNQMKKVWEKACALDAARKDSCYSEAQSALGTLPAKTEGGKSGLERFNEEVDAIRDTANELNDRTDDVFEKGIKYAGIQAFMNVAGLEALVQSLCDEIAAFHANVTAHASAVDAALAARWAEYEAGIGTITTKWFAKRSATLNHDMLEELKAYLAAAKTELDELTELECGKDLEQLQSDLEDICAQVQETFKSSVKCQPAQNGAKGKSSSTY